ncbi:androgen-induced gene 1 protein isoform X3 [Camelus ferus]|uniref:Androgen-induced gene 1 protein isoform X3 n=2 Tax=Camelus TaxID=9836 RepID=A0A8B8TFD7_CAMFR|nr:androgen-induced gene 1 protein isoform X3 [Camelus ferus]XP_045380689.1 androgen-induced gene 1 protein isoform X3 [Camelus bactrianus]
MALVPCQVLRVAILLSYCSILCNYKAIEMPSHQTYGGSWKFLTFIDLSTRRGIELQQLKETGYCRITWSFLWKDQSPPDKEEKAPHKEEKAPNKVFFAPFFFAHCQ